jgi:rare lipoprotein A
MITPKGFKRFCFIFLIFAVPMASSEPISVSQETVFYKNFTPEIKTQKAKLQPRTFKVSAPVGIASWYSETDPGINLHTANGEIFDDGKLTCASWNHSFGTLLKVTNLKNGKSVVCRVNDRGPNKRLGRLIDLTITAFRRIADSRSGLIRVAVIQLTN